ncbi:hypothetical protein HU200_000769 [Digitaria exilis]|uniref:Uncharacterized protein n=1 Tax=Digitaria exilis TaxID=1010633 RepID=A0A835L0F0_9POAL|nr:hypothetical protein HU200_000769 [Digitaria exilis]
MVCHPKSVCHQPGGQPRQEHGHRLPRLRRRRLVVGRRRADVTTHARCGGGDDDDENQTHN